jgi:hypothetical protein
MMQLRRVSAPRHFFEEIMIVDTAHGTVSYVLMPRQLSANSRFCPTGGIAA